jgi:pyruvate dehydrogenase kinase 2/3/4
MILRLVVGRRLFASSTVSEATQLQTTLGSVGDIEKPRVRVLTRAAAAPKSASPMHRIWSTAREQLQPVTISDMLALHDLRNPEATLVQSALWLQTELQRRIARQVVALSQMPFGICMMPSARRIRDDYVKSYRDLSETAPPTTFATTLAFSDKLEFIYARHSTMLSLMAKAVFELEQSMAQGPDGGADDLNAFLEFANVDDAFSNFLTRRIGIRFLLGHHLALLADHKRGVQSKSICGLIDRELSPYAVAADAASAAMSLCRDTYGFAPEIHVDGSQTHTLPYVRDHLMYILMELFKNSCRATVERYSDSREIPPIRVTIGSEEHEDVAIKVSDAGGGIPRTHMRRVWSYLYTTAPKNAKELMTHMDNESPIAGLGFGLPVSRLHARYFGGDLQMLSMPGRGTDCVLYLRRLGDIRETESVLPA